MDDLVCRFGDLNATNFKEIGQLAGVVKLNVGKEIPIELMKPAKMDADPKDTLTYRGSKYQTYKGVVKP